MNAVLDAIRAWARVRGYWLRQPKPKPIPEWNVVIVGQVITVFHGTGGATRQWDLDPNTALLWATAVESGVMLDAGGEWKPLARLICDVAHTTYTERRSSSCQSDRTKLLALVVGEGWRVEADHGAYLGISIERWDFGCPKAREAVQVAGDHLLARGDPLGEWIAAWLRGECRMCDGHPSICDHASGRIEAYGCADCMNTGHTVADSCSACAGHGVMLGAHVDAMVAMLGAAEAT